MFLSIVSKNGKRVAKDAAWDSIFTSEEQYQRFWDWAWAEILFSEAKARVEALGYKIRSDQGSHTAPNTIQRFRIWRYVSPDVRKPEVVEFEDMKLEIKVS